MKKRLMIDQLGEYFTKKGKYLDLKEYDKQEDRPIRSQLVKRNFNSWSRMMLMLKNYYPDIENKASVKKPAEKKVKKDVK